MTERIVVGSDGRKYITHEPAPKREWQDLTDARVRGKTSAFDPKTLAYKNSEER